ncbi:MAG: hypothetical protein ACYC9K_00915 [Sulfuricaulis sp.]
MQIRCKLHREGGTKVDFSKDGPFNKGRMAAQYHFKPNRQGHHVCDVKDKEHVNRFLSLSDAFEHYDPGFEQKEIERLASASTIPEGGEDDGSSGPETPVSTEGGQDKKPSNSQTVPVDYSKFSHSELLAMVEDATGQKPKGNSSKESLIAALVEMDNLPPDAQ